MEYMLSILTILAETISGVYICDATMKRQNDKKFFRFEIFLLVTITFSLFHLIPALTPPSFLKSSITFLSWFLIVLFFYESIIFLKIFICIIRLAIVALYDTFTVFFLVSIFKITQHEFLMNPLLWLLATFISKILLFTSSYCFKRICKDKAKFNKLNTWILCGVIIIPIFTILSLYILIQVAKLEESVIEWTFLHALVLFIINVILVTLLDRVAHEQAIKTENILYNKELTNKMELAKAWSDTLQKQKRISHDFKHHIETLNTLLQNDDVNEAKNYIKTISVESKMGMVVDSNNPIINAVLNQKYWIAKEKGIIIRFKIDDIAQFPIKQADLATLLANLLDNAIEATEKVYGEKCIIVKITMDEVKTLLSVRNTSLPVCIDDNNNISTTKINFEEHGFGLKNIKTVLDKYRFSYAFEYKSSWFNFSAVLYKF